MNKDYTHITLLVDRSGSMISILDGAQEGVNALLKQQFALDGKVTVTLTEFSSIRSGWGNDFSYKFKNSQSLTRARLANKPFEYKINPDGGTALYDAIVDEIMDTGRDLRNMPEEERPAKVVFVIVTDGEENSSRRFKLGDAKSLIQEQVDKYDWQFMFLGADQSAWQGQQMGIRNNWTYANNSQATMDSYIGASQIVAGYRSGATANIDHSNI